jgi:hypothetical protein
MRQQPGIGESATSKYLKRTNDALAREREKLLDSGLFLGSYRGTQANVAEP